MWTWKTYNTKYYNFFKQKTILLRLFFISTYILLHTVRGYIFTLMPFVSFIFVVVVTIEKYIINNKIDF